ncbi:two pore domain potassium channel family protein [Belnapia sp. T6]|uniref:Two pore domain potassium channel family protein n=1 Tax=Belnapia mucosa TaxID=2804532 RepID=A0ABS1V3I7_9PROT|nr:potassium channel family protein [Belnapia mucosa]MBL6456257.1 two pore domain potassium channel family protein [Belnapia mucosa]
MRWARRTPRGFLTAFGMSLGLMLLVAGGVADRGGTFPLVLLGASALAIGALTLLFPHGPQFALGTTNGLAMYACLFVVLGRAGFPDATDWARAIAFLLPILGFVGACVIRRRVLSAWAEEEEAADLAHLPRFARWLAVTGLVGVVSLSLPINRLDAAGQGVALICAMGAIGLVSAIAVGDVVRLLVDIAVIFRVVTRRLSRLAVPIAAYSSLWALLTVVFGCLYRIADGLSSAPLYTSTQGPVRIDFSDALHFSVVTLSTVGYGDIIPLDDGIRLLAGIQMLLAQLLLLFGFIEIMRGSRAGLPDAGAEPPGHASVASRTHHSTVAEGLAHDALAGEHRRDFAGDEARFRRNPGPGL